MCHDADSRPPAPPRSGPVGRHGPLELTAADGNRFAAYEAVPEGEPRAGVVILPDVRGLHPYYVALAQRFAEAGLHAVAFDYFGRTAGVGQRDADFEYMPHVQQLGPQHVLADARAVTEHLRAAGRTAVFSVGFCLGGSHSWRLAAGDLGLSGCIGFYGRPVRVEDVADRVSAPILMLIAGADQATPTGEALALADRFRAAGVEVEAQVYDGAPHSFFDRAFADWADACADAWRRIDAFVDVHA